MTTSGRSTFGKQVRIRSTAETENLGFAGLVGHAYGQTTPSVTGVDVIGDSEDMAVGVSFSDRQDTYWFAPDLIELVDSSEEVKIEIGGSEYVNSETGEWKKLPKKH